MATIPWYVSLSLLLRLTFRHNTAYLCPGEAELSRTISSVATTSCRPSPVPVRLFIQQAVCDGSNGDEVLSDGRESRPGDPGVRDIIEADHTDVARHLDAQVGQPAHQSEGHIVVAAHHCRCSGSNNVGGLGSRGVDRPAGFDPIGNWRGGVSQGVLPGAYPGPGLTEVGQGQVVNGPMPQSEEVLGGLPTAAVFVLHDQRLSVARIGPDHHRW